MTHVSIRSCHTSLHAPFFFGRSLNFGAESSGRGEQTPERLDFKALSPSIIGETWQTPPLLHNKTSKGLHLVYITAAWMCNSRSGRNTAAWRARFGPAGSVRWLLVLSTPWCGEAAVSTALSASSPLEWLCSITGATNQVLIRHFSQQLDATLPSRPNRRFSVEMEFVLCCWFLSYLCYFSLQREE